MPLLFLGIWTSQALHLVGICLPDLSSLRRIRRSGLSQWGHMVLLASGPLLVGEVDKLWARHPRRACPAGLASRDR
ncbi:hypothetical protein [Rhizobium halophytocola]|uniref:hypothetical protein n=1 Tax=Rhizobium halophytocola TaxID=735519 RepID=UPI001AE64DB6|nr:hypothetical protein [Rhizobium halophytocola]